MFLLEVVAALQKQGVKFAIAGGYAVALHGAVRGTVDVDVVLALQKTDYLNCEKAMRALGLISRVPVSADEVFHFRNQYIKERNLIAWSFSDPTDPSRLVDIILTYDKKTVPIKMVTVVGKEIPVLAKQSLIKMKQVSSRPQDLEDVKALRRLYE